MYEGGFFRCAVASDAAFDFYVLPIHVIVKSESVHCGRIVELGESCDTGVEILLPSNKDTVNNSLGGIKGSRGNHPQSRSEDNAYFMVPMREPPTAARQAGSLTATVTGHNGKRRLRRKSVLDRLREDDGHGRLEKVELQASVLVIGLVGG